MSRLKNGARRDSGLPNKRDTPVKLERRQSKFRRLLPNKHYEALPEQPEEEENHVRPTSPVLTSTKPVHLKSVLRMSSSAITENCRGKAVSPAAPANRKSGHQVSSAGHSTVQMTPKAEAFKGDEMRVKEEEQKLAVTLESITCFSMETDTAFSSVDDEDSSASSASSSLPSPEIFRKENYVETETFPIHEELPGLHIHLKNSTLLDASQAENIDKHHSPNLSVIIDASTILAENTCEIKGPEAEIKIHTHLIKSDKPCKRKTPPKLTNRRPILCKKKVWFKSPMIAETFEAKHIPATKLTIHHASKPVQASSPAEQMEPVADTSRAGEINSKEESVQPMVRLKRPVRSNPDTAKFFDFIDDSKRDAFFQMMRERSVKLRSTPLFPLTACNT